MLFDPTERNVNPIPTRARPMKKLVLTLAVLDKNVTVAKTAQASFTVRKGLVLPFEERVGAKAHRDDKHRLPALPKQQLVIAGGGSGSRQVAPLPQHTKVASGVR